MTNGMMVMFENKKIQEALIEIYKENPHYVANFDLINNHLCDAKIEDVDDKHEWLRLLGEYFAAVFYSDFYKYNEFHDAELSSSYLEQIISQNPIILDLFIFINNIFLYATDDSFKNMKINVRAIAADNPTVITLGELIADTSDWYNARDNANKNKVVVYHTEDLITFKSKSNKPKVSFDEKVAVHKEDRYEDSNIIISDHYEKLAPPDKSAGLWWALKNAFRHEVHAIRRRKSTVTALEDHDHDGVKINRPKTNLAKKNMYVHI